MTSEAPARLTKDCRLAAELFGSKPRAAEGAEP